jgi:hypothetical protein
LNWRRMPIDLHSGTGFRIIEACDQYMQAQELELA